MEFKPDTKKLLSSSPETKKQEIKKETTTTKNSHSFMLSLNCGTKFKGV